VLGKYARPQKYAVEGLLLYAQSKYMSNLDPVERFWALFGVVIRLALRVGYHRDPDHLPGISVFEGEMRRHTWAIIRQLDILESFQMGLPGSIQAHFCDTEIPRNLNDNDFGKATVRLPPLDQIQSQQMCSISSSRAA
jgi:Fungal specific transcription factor domain